MTIPRTLCDALDDLRPKDRGASLIEYALLVALIAIVCFAAVTFLGDATGDSFSRTGESVSAT